MKYFAISLLSLALLSSCNKEENNDENLRFIFGGYAGECFGNCANLYLLTENELFADDVEYLTLSADELKFQSDPLEESKYLLAKSFYNNFPEELMLSTQSVYGIPDAYDQGGYYISLNSSDTTRVWTIDTNKDVLPDILKSYMSELDTLMSQL